MKLIIDIPEVFYETSKKVDEMVSGQRSGKTLMSVIFDAVANGTPLPKHGRLIDADALLRKHTKIDTYPFPSTTINSAPTIIEADKAYAVEVITRGNCMICGKELDEGLFFCKECEAKVESEGEE